MDKITSKKLKDMRGKKIYNFCSHYLNWSKKTIRLSLFLLMSFRFKVKFYKKIFKNQFIKEFAFVSTLLVDLLFSNSSFSQDFIQIRQKAISEETNPDFTYDTLGVTISNFKTTAL